ncbi:hypothetical protein AN395_03472 [Pseudoalteromonas sp. P1-30]|uniref:PDZ domain-containing protein n=1 Tax=Pseudoalteromonas sp. P1-30 TaxID=1723760 RepID=UPI0006D5FED7|nr:PDZ domain-containing protein [Pseudoalteromonas sp. P1-30]KPV90133.1 hypothetical protein AN395_03472 [Pseudoalteromonas sp. P1-30]
MSVSGFFSPEISERDIIKAFADLAGLKVGDKVIELDGSPIPACSAEFTKKSMTKSSGETLLLLIKSSMAAKSK